MDRCLLVQEKNRTQDGPHIRVLVPGGRSAQVDGEASRHDLIKDLFHGQEYDIFCSGLAICNDTSFVSLSKKTDIVFLLIFSNVQYNPQTVLLVGDVSEKLFLLVDGIEDPGTLRSVCALTTAKIHSEKRPGKNKTHSGW